ncbi:N-acetylmuramic acid 6-phosphate etherase [Alicyclobacillus fodiniaquatilis]|uniref:N-acetylmuramic acid 6-phosphate etherase n=1 Tax=Alicyclobacillus fodiniaquatilis TaxID=1661150 RepID=A0ABW4JJ18_9BACL
MLEQLHTEQPNPASERLDASSSLEIITLMNQADKTVPLAVEGVLPIIAIAIDAIVDHLKQGGRLFYVGAGTSGRLGVLDAAECPPTFSAPPELVQAVMAGGQHSVFQATENAEDDPAAGADALAQRQLTALDAIVGLSASGRTPFVIGAIDYAKSVGALTIALCCNPHSSIGTRADIAIDVDTGPEVLMGSTRLKAGTAQKMVLNMLSTGVMVKMGKVYKNLMVDLKATNYKLIERSKRIIMLATGVSYEMADATLATADGQVKQAILMLEKDVSAQVAARRLEQADGHLREALLMEEDAG